MEIPAYILNLIKHQGGGIEPTGEIEITENGTYDVSTYASASVQTPVPTGTISITENGTVDVSSYASANVNVQGAAVTIDNTFRFNGSTFQTMPTWLCNATYTGNLKDVFKNCTGLKTASLNNTSGVTSLETTFNGCYNLESITINNTSNVTSFASTFYLCSKLETAPTMDMSSATTVRILF